MCVIFVNNNDRVFVDTTSRGEVGLGKISKNDFQLEPFIRSSKTDLFINGKNKKPTIIDGFQSRFQKLFKDDVQRGLTTTKSEPDAIYSVVEYN